MPSRTSRGIMPEERPKVPEITLAIVLRNAVAHLPNLLGDVSRQTLGPQRFELLVVDGMSDDGSLGLVEEFRRAHQGHQIRILPNPGLILATGWNLALARAAAPILVRVDVHARIDPTFLEMCLEVLADGESIVGGPVISEFPGGNSSLIHAVESSRLGGSAAAFRRQEYAGYVDTVAYAAYRREVFKKVGGFDERLVRNQDNDMHMRLRQAGYRFRFDPRIRSRHIMRATWRGLLAQKFRNGRWVALASALRPGAFSARHLLPAAYVLALLIAAVAGSITHSAWPLTVLLGIHLMAGAASAIATEHGRRYPLRVRVLLPAALCLVHAAYGSGTLIGVVQAPWFLLSNRRSAPPRPLDAAPCHEEEA